MKNILLTGGAGFIGSNILEYLVNNDYKFIRIVDNLSTGSINNIKKFITRPNVQFIKGDIRDINFCMNIMKNIDIVCHQAALGSVPRSIDNPLNSHDNNVNGFLNILLAAKENNIKRIVYASSSSVYGDDNNLPKNENIMGNPLSPYAVTKLIDELYAYIFTNVYNMECIGLRYFNVFGPKQNPDGPYAAVIPKTIINILNDKNPIIYGSGEYSRDFTYIDNVVMANIKALFTDNKSAYGEVFNVGTNSSIKIYSIYKLVNKLLDKNLDPIYKNTRKGDIPHSNADINKIEKILGYKVIINYEEGLKKTIEYYKNE